MQYNNWSRQCPYAGICGYGYPVDYNRYHNPSDWDNELLSLYANDADEDMEMNGVSDPGDLSRAQSDVERVIPLAFQKSANEINQAIAMGMPPNLIAYLIREMVQFIDRNYNNYSASYNYNITQASDDIKSSLYWILNIFRVYGVPFDIQMRILNNTVITAMQNLRSHPGGAAAQATTPAGAGR